MAEAPSVRKNAIAEYIRTREVYRSESLAILVDGFRNTAAYINSVQGDFNGSSRTSDNPRSTRVLFFLSHFHSDHYSGITDSWRHGTIYASRGTANLLCWKLGVSELHVKRMDCHMVYVFSLTDGELMYERGEGEKEKENGVVDTFSVTLIPACHCPGSVMFLFRSSVFGTILHTGDFRFTREDLVFSHSRHALQVPHPHNVIDMSKDPALISVAGKVDVLYLDNTFCDKRFNFPGREDCYREVNQMILSEFRKHTCADNSETEKGSTPTCKRNKRVISVAVFIGTYFIGKERIALSIQENFLPVDITDDAAASPFVPIYVSREKHEALWHLDYYHNHFVTLPQHEGKEKCKGSTLEGFVKHAVRLPEDNFPSSQDVARDLRLYFDEAVLSSQEEVYLLTIFLVPLSSVTYPTLSKTCGRGVKRQRSEDGIEEDSASSQKNASLQKEIFPLFDNEVIDLKQFNGVVCVEPTGWRRKSSKVCISDRVTLLRVPYSEHCSFTELVDFVHFMNPARIVPTVSTKLFKEYETLFAENAPCLRQYCSNVQPISRFLSPKLKLSEEEKNGDDRKDFCVNNSVVEKQRNPFTFSATEKDVIIIDDDSDDDDNKNNNNGINTADCTFIQLVNAKKEEKIDANRKNLAGVKSEPPGPLKKSGDSKSHANNPEKCIKNIVPKKLSAKQRAEQMTLTDWKPSCLRDRDDDNDDDDDCVFVDFRSVSIKTLDSSN